ncbi:MAG: DUF5698 domain-containing protein [bacterium]|nr:DUF5698 domain-containing protein [bacterium]
MFIYISIFLSKIIENTLATLRLIVVANGKKKLGAILQGVVAIVWIFVTGIVIIDINKDPLKIVFFCLGTIIGSYLGSLIEEKIALGNILLMCVTKNKFEQTIKDKLNNLKITTISEKNDKYSVLLIFLKRKEIANISKIIKDIDNNSTLISQKAKYIV